MNHKHSIIVASALVLSVCGNLFGQAQDTNQNATKPEQPEEVTNQRSEWADLTPGPGGMDRQVIVSFRDVVLKSNDVAQSVVVIGANARIEGKTDTAVVIGGDLTVTGTGYVRHESVAVLGDIHALNGSKFDDDVVAAGGKVESADEVKFRKSPFEIDPGGLGHALKGWIFQCVFKLRPLAPSVGWVWGIWAAFFLIYFLVAIILPVPVTACVTELGRRPATTFFIGLLSKLMVPLILGILVATGVGVLVVPFAVAALIFGAIVGKVALFEFLGSAFGRRLGLGVLQNSIIAFIVGVLIITLLYMVPVLGLIALGVVSVWGLGGAVTAAFWGLKKEAPEKRTVPLAATVPANATAAFAGVGTGAGPGASAENSGPAGVASPGQTPPQHPAAAGNVPEAYAYPRGGFWERVAAAFLDWVLVGIVSGFCTHLIHAPAPIFLVPLIYFCGMWAWKGTTIGGVVVGLKVVRQDGYPVTFLVSIVRALAAAFSIFIFCLGFLWIIFDREKQGWHDKIAGTVVIKLPKGTPLVLV